MGAAKILRFTTLRAHTAFDTWQCLGRKYSNLQSPPLQKDDSLDFLEPFGKWQRTFVSGDGSGFLVKLVFYKTKTPQPDQWLCMAFLCSTRDLLWKTNYAALLASLCGHRFSWHVLWRLISLHAAEHGPLLALYFSVLCDQTTTLPPAKGKWKITDPFSFFLWDLYLLLSPFFCLFHLTAYNRNS